MAAQKKAVAAKEEVKAVQVEASVKAEPKKEEKKVEAKVEKKEEAKAPVKAEKKVEAKKAPAKKAAATKKVDVKTEISIQFAGKSYTQDDLVKIAKDVWKFDLKKKASDFKSVELYVKPEESLVYYVINKEVAGSFMI